MKITEERERTGTYTTTIKRICDICEAESDGDSWKGGTYVVDETELRITVSQEEGESYPEGGRKTILEVDLCPDCFKDKLVPWVEEEGDTTIEPKEVDW